MIPALEEAGIPVLVNDAVRIETGKGDLWVVGIDDGLLGTPDLDAAFAGVPADAASICLWHEPDRVEESAPYGSFLQLSGHTHGGQVRLAGRWSARDDPKLGQALRLLRPIPVGDMELVRLGTDRHVPATGPVEAARPELTMVRLQVGMTGATWRTLSCRDLTTSGGLLANRSE